MANSKFSYENQLTALTDFMQKEINELNSLPEEQAKKKARAGLIRVGVLDTNGQIAKPYAATKNNVQESEGVNNMCGIAERLTEKGRAEGRTEGKTEERKLLVTNMLKNHMSPELIAKVCEINLEEVIEIQKNC